MRSARILLAVGTLLTCIPSLAFAQCPSFSAKDSKCSSSTLSRFKIDFRSVNATETPIRPPVQQSLGDALASAQAPIARDCAIIHPADTAVDPLIAKRPPTGVTFTILTVVIPACPRR